MINTTKNTNSYNTTASTLPSLRFNMQLVNACLGCLGCLSRYPAVDFTWYPGRSWQTFQPPHLMLDSRVNNKDAWPHWTSWKQQNLQRQTEDHCQTRPGPEYHTRWAGLQKSNGLFSCSLTQFKKLRPFRVGVHSYVGSTSFPGTALQNWYVLSARIWLARTKGARGPQEVLASQTGMQNKTSPGLQCLDLASATRHDCVPWPSSSRYLDAHYAAPSAWVLASTLIGIMTRIPHIRHPSSIDNSCCHVEKASMPWTATAGLATPIWCIETPYWEWSPSLWLSELQKLSQAKPQSDWCWKYLVLQNTPDQLPLIEEAITIHWHYHGDAWTWTPPHAISRHENCPMLKSSSSQWWNSLFGTQNG